MYYFYHSDPESESFLSTEESSHCVKVLRKKSGDTIEIIDGKGFLYTCTIQEANFRKCTFQINEKKYSASSEDYHLHICIAPTKNQDRLEWFVEKACELAVHEISIVNTQRTERKKVNLQRLEKKAISALKQSKNLFKTQIISFTAFKELLHTLPLDAQKFIAFVDHDNPKNLFHEVQPKKNTIVLIGPEGDFTNEEVAFAIDSGFKKVSLGKSVLRTETAGVVAANTVILKNS